MKNSSLGTISYVAHEYSLFLILTLKMLRILLAFNACLHVLAFLFCFKEIKTQNQIGYTVSEPNIPWNIRKQLLPILDPHLPNCSDLHLLLAGVPMC